ncbi:MAG: hypothetical protein QOH69_493 [Actinomycetota bacterium]|jgi:hypothetical protein|nr:hypothetical protein [Actinomycetota bacterium]
MTDTAPPDEPTSGAQPPKSKTGRLIGLSIGGGVVFIAMVTVVLMVALSVVGSTGLPAGAAKRALLTASDLAAITGVEIASGQDSVVRKHSLQAYVKENPGDTSNTVTPAKCADNLEGWMAWKALDNPSYRGWKSDVIFEASNIVVDSENSYENGLQESRRFASVAAASAFMNAQRGWYKECATSSYADPGDSTNNATYRFSPISLDLGLDSVIEGSTNRGKGLPPHLIDVYLRKQNIVYVTELVTNSAPQHGMDPVSLAIVKTAAKKLSSLR